MANNHALFSVIIPAHNQENTIDETLQSVSRQVFRDFETIVVDDGSTDSTPERVRQYKWVRLVWQENIGAGAARNRGALEARGTYLAFLDSDDLWYPWTLLNYARVIDKYCSSFISGVGIEFRDGITPDIHESECIVEKHQDYLAAGMQGNWVGTCGVAIKRSVFLDIGGFLTENINAEDSDLWLRMGKISPFLRLSSPFSYAYRRSPSSATGNLPKTVAGVCNVIDQERMGRYPGGQERQKDRRAIIGAHARPVVIACIKSGKIHDAWHLYRNILSIQVRQLRFKFVLGAPLLAILSTARICLNRLTIR